MNIEELALTEEEYNEDRNYVFLTCLANANTTRFPEATFVVGQPGAGKTKLSRVSNIELKKRNNGTMPVNVNADMVAQYHRNYNKLLEFKPEDRQRITREFVNPAIKEIQDTLSKHRVSMVIECTLNSDKKLAFMEKLKQQGYKVNIKVMVVHELESKISCLEREAALLRMGNKARGIDRKSHNDAYKNMPKTIKKILDNGVYDNIELYTRGKNGEEPKKIEKDRDVDVVEMIETERINQRKQILSDPEKFLKRLERIKKDIEFYQQNEMLKKYSLTNLAELEKEFQQELEKYNQMERV